MNYRLVLLDSDSDYGCSMSDYFRKKKITGGFKNWELEYIESPEFYGMLSRGTLSSGELAENKDYRDFFLLGEGFSEKDLLVNNFMDEGIGAALGVGYLSKNPNEPFYRYGGPEKIIKEIERRIENKESPSLLKKNETLVVAGVGISGGVGNTTVLISINEELKARGFRTAYMDLNYWGNLSKYEDQGNSIELSFLRFIYSREPKEFGKAFPALLEEKGTCGSLVIGSINEMDCSSEKAKIEVVEVVGEIVGGHYFDFVLLDGNKHLLADGYFSDFAINELLITENSRGENAIFLDRLCSYYKSTTGIDVVKVINGRDHSEIALMEGRSIRRKSLASSGGKGLLSNKAKGLPWGKKEKITDKEKEKLEYAVERFDAAATTDYLVGRWLKSDK